MLYVITSKDINKTKTKTSIRLFLNELLNQSSSTLQVVVCVY